MSKQTVHRILTVLIALVWIANGLFCKVLNFVPRHEQIVAGILGDEYASALIKLIGVAEIAMAVWIISGIKKPLNAITQIAIIATMNTLELTLTPDLLLWGKANAAFALLFMLIIYYNEFHLNKKTIQE